MQGRPGPDEHHEGVPGPAQQRHHRDPGLRPARGQHRGEQDPGDRVVGGGAGQRDGADPRAGQAPVVHDPREDRERRDGDRRTDEQHRLPARDPRREPTAAHQQQPEGGTRDQRSDQARRTGDNRGPHVRPQQRGVEREPDQEHVQRQPELSHDVQHRHRRPGREERGLDPRCDRPEQ